MVLQILGEAADPLSVDLVSSAVAERHEFSPLRLEHISHIVGGGSPGCVVVNANEGVFPVVNTGDDMHDRNALGAHFSELGFNLRMIGSDNDQARPAESWRGYMPGDTQRIEFVQKRTMDEDARIE